MSNDTSVQDDEHNAVNKDEGQVDAESSQNAEDSEEDSSKGADSEDTKTPEQKAREEHDTRVFQGMVNAEVAKVATGDKKLEEVDEYLRKHVEESLNKNLAPKEENSEEKIAERVAAKLKLDHALESLLPEEQTKARADYDTFIKGEYSVDESIIKVKKLYNVLSPEETERLNKIQSMRSHKLGQTSEEKKSDRPEAKTDKEKRFVKSIRRGREKDYKEGR